MQHESVQSNGSNEQIHVSFITNTSLPPKPQHLLIWYHLHLISVLR
jgi:hypothetical protein